jgi:hypothetical protein
MLGHYLIRTANTKSFHNELISLKFPSFDAYESMRPLLTIQDRADMPHLVIIHDSWTQSKDKEMLNGNINLQCQNNRLSSDVRRLCVLECDFVGL